MDTQNNINNKISFSFPSLYRKRKLKNKDFTIISNNCCGGLIYRTLGIKYNSPTVNSWISRKDFFVFCNNLKEYFSYELEEYKDNTNQ